MEMYDVDTCAGCGLCVLSCFFFPDTRETGFVNAITAAGVTFAVTRACTMGDLIECSCDKSTKGTAGGSITQGFSNTSPSVGI